MDKDALFLSEYPAGDLSRKKKIPLSFQMLLQAILSYSFQMLLQAISSRKRKWCHIPFRISCRPSFLARKNIPYSFYIDALTGQPFLEEKRYHIPFRCSCRTLFLRINKKIFHVPSSSSIYLNGISIVTLYMWLINKSKWEKKNWPFLQIVVWTLDNKALMISVLQYSSLTLT